MPVSLDGQRLHPQIEKHGRQPWVVEHLVPQRHPGGATGQRIANVWQRPQQIGSRLVVEHEAPIGPALPVCQNVQRLGFADRVARNNSRTSIARHKHLLDPLLVAKCHPQLLRPDNQPFEHRISLTER